MYGLDFKLIWLVSREVSKAGFGLPFLQRMNSFSFVVICVAHKDKITSKFKAKMLLRQTRVTFIKDSSVTLLSKNMQIKNQFRR